MKISKVLYEYVPNLASILYIILFIYAGLSKFLDFENFKTQLGQSPVLTAYADYIVWIIPSVEFAVAFMFLFSQLQLMAFKFSFSLMTMFTVYIVLVLNFSDYIPCSCGGVLETLGWTEHIIFNLVFILLAVSSIVLIDRGKKSNKANTL